MILLLDGHTSHMSVSALELASANNIILICFPSHTSQYLQPLDRSFFGLLKHYFKEACQSWMAKHFKPNILQPRPGQARVQFGELLCKTWDQAATLENATSGFRATGIVPLVRGGNP